jgi:hypothetical protein
VTDYTRKEAAAIRSAYCALAYIAECTDISAPIRLREAVRYEAKQRSSVRVAEALMVSQAAAGIDSSPAFRATLASPLDAAGLWQLSTGLAVAYMFGADIGRRYRTSSDHADQIGASRFRDRIRDFIAVAGDAQLAFEGCARRRRAAL